MSDNPLGDQNGTIFDLINQDAAFAAKVTSLVARIRQDPGIVSEETALGDIDLDYRALKSLLLTYVNGSADLQTQRVNVEYLKQDQKMSIPLGLAMLPYEVQDPEVRMHPILTPRYWRVSRVPYHELKQRLLEKHSTAQVRTWIDGLPLPPAADRVALFRWPDVFTLQDGTADDPSAVAITFGFISNCLQFNCDIRDVGLLTDENMRLADNAWQTIANASENRFMVRIKAYTIQTLAAMNYESCHSCALAAWTRAYGVGTGCLPTRSSKLQKEYFYSANMPLRTARVAVFEFEDKTEEPLYPVTMNLLGMFGLFHLAKDHTYRTGDANMDRIGLSYLTTLRTMVHSTLMDEMRGHQEALVRTSQHPFGLGQTYAVAVHLYRYNKMATPLRLRVSATPPPVQRLFIIMAARDEWGIMPIGPTIIDIFGKQLELIRAETVEILKNAPGYSGLYDLYGYDVQLQAAPDAYTAASTLLPVVYGYAMVQHSDSGNKKEGLALALSLQNVASQHKTLTTQWQRMWESYIEKSDKEGLEKFLRTAYTATFE